MTLFAAFCISWLLLLFFFLFLTRVSNWRVFVLQLGSLVISFFVVATAVYATINLWPPPFACGVPTSWPLASWVALSLILLALFWYDQQTDADENVRGIAGWAIVLISLFGGWAGAILAQLFLKPSTGQFSQLLLIGLTCLVNVVFWSWLIVQI